MHLSETSEFFMATKFFNFTLPPHKILSICRYMLFEDFFKAMYTFPPKFLSLTVDHTVPKWKLKEAIGQKILWLSALP